MGSTDLIEQELADAEGDWKIGNGGKGRVCARGGWVREKASGMTIDLNEHQIGVINRLSMKEEHAAVAADHHKGECRGIPCAVFEPSPDRKRNPA
jgi:hypothetical protein